MRKMADRGPEVILVVYLLAQKICLENDESHYRIYSNEPVHVKPIRSPAQNWTDARKVIIREVEDVIHDEADKADAKALRDEFYVRLDTPDLEDDLEHRPVADIIREICIDLGLAEPTGASPSLRRTPDDIARLRARAAAPSAPPDPPDRRSRI